MSNNFRVGQKVVCVPQCPGQWRHDAPYNGPVPEEGQVYTVTGIRDTGHPGIIGLFLEEFPSNHLWDVNDFRPAVERGTDTGMAILTKILLDNLVDA